MRKTFILTLVLLVVAAFAYAQTGSTASTGTATATTGTTTTTTTTTTHKHAAAHSVHGTVASLDAGTKSITVHPKTGADVTVKANDKTTYWNGKAKGSWDDVKQGGWVTISYHNDGTDNWALKVHIMAEKTGAASGAAAAAPKSTGK
jgi:hypothetical protein